MRPFFSYYGAKYIGSKHYGPPRRDLVIEPFAGSACYSVRWDVKYTKLYDVSEAVCSLWDWLIHCSEADVLAIPSSFESFDEIIKLPVGPRTLVQFWVAKGCSEPAKTLSPWYFQYRNSGSCQVWSEAVQRRVIKQKPTISNWTIDCLSYNQIPQIEAHWHVDPPYNNSAGRAYSHSDIDYVALGIWCQALPGAVDVCENVGADWLPFTPLYEVVSCGGRNRVSGTASQEAVWRKDTSRTDAGERPPESRHFTNLPTNTVYEKISIEIDVTNVG